MAVSALHSSETVEHLTPPNIVMAAQDVLGRIELDPASTPFANTLIKAKRIYTAKDDGLSKKWKARTVFLNPPGGVYDTAQKVPVLKATKTRESCTVTGACGLKPGHKHQLKDIVSMSAIWWAKLTNSVESGLVKEAIFLGFSLEILASAQRFGCAHPLDYVVCVPENRLKFDTVAKRQRIPGNSPTHSNIIVYLGGTVESELKFADRFEQFGYVR